MAKQLILLDDLDQTVIDAKLGGGTVDFSFDGKHYTIDLGVANKDRLRQALKPFIDAAEEVEGPRRSAGAAPSRKRAPSGSGRSKEELQAIRDWCASQGIEVAPRGRIKADILEAFDKAHES